MSVIVESNGARKQKAWRPRDSEDEDAGITFKKSRINSWYFTLESESPVATDEDDESVYTVQGQETEYAHDTSDTNTHTWISSNSSSTSEGENVSVHLEYEIDTQSDQNDSEASGFSSSDPENVLTVGLVSCVSDQDLADLADDSDDEPAAENGKVRKTNYYKICIICKGVNSNPLFSYCETCFQNKKTHYNRPKRRRKQNSTCSQSSGTSKTTMRLVGSQELSEMDSGIGSSQELGSTASSVDPLLNLQISSNTESDNVDSVLGDRKNVKVSEPTPIERLSPLTILAKKLKQNGNVPKTSNENTDNSAEGLCLVCTTNPKNGIFVHGKYSHICCCYNCSKKVWAKNGMRCPICARKVTQILKAFYV